ncbi:MAG: helix-turn-helix domain-containing protein [Bacteroidota bacterium]
MTKLFLEPEIVFPSKDLSHIIHHFEFFHYREHASSSFTLFPSLDTGLLFIFSPNYLNTSTDITNRGSKIVPCSFVPPRTLPYCLQLPKYFVGLKVVFQPGMYSYVYDTHLQAYQNKFVDAALHFDSSLTSMQAELSALGENEKKVLAFETYLRDSLERQEVKKRRPFLQIMRQIMGRYRPEETATKLALRLQLSRRHLNRILNQELGFSAKAFLKILRFTHLLYFIHRNMKMDFCQIALEFGFCDQAHFCKEFKRMSGSSPGNYLKWVKENQVLTRVEYLQNGLLVFPNRMLFGYNQYGLEKKVWNSEFPPSDSKQTVLLAG